MFDNIIKWVKNHKIYFFAIATLALIGIPFVIHILFKITAIIPFFEAEWSAGDILGYYGSTLTFIGTASLSILALHQTDQIRIESAKRDLENNARELAQNRPSFTVRPIECKDYYSNLHFRLYNTSDNIAKNVKLISVSTFHSYDEGLLSDEPVSPEKGTFQFKKTDDMIPIIQGGKYMQFELTTHFVNVPNILWLISMSCEDKFDNELQYNIKAHYKKGMSAPSMEIEKSSYQIFRKEILDED